MVPVITGALGTVLKDIEKWLADVEGTNVITGHKCNIGHKCNNIWSQM